MAVEKIFAVNAWSVSAVSWSGQFNTIDALGTAQINIFYKLASSSTWVAIEKVSYRDTYISSSKSVDLTNATYDSSGSSVPASLDSSIHELKITRSTSLTPYIEFQNGAKLDATDINTVGRQALHRIEEEAARLDAADTAIYAYVDNRFLDYYTKAQIDNFFNTQTVPNWATGVDYKVGDTVLHNDPNDGLNTILVWYATVDHTSDTTVNQPSSTGSGPSYWSVVAPNDSIANLSFIRRVPGIVTTENEWNTIQPANINASGLIFKPNASQAAPLIKTFKQDGTTASLTLTSGTASSGVPTNQDNLYLASTVLSTESDSWFQYTGANTSYFNFRSSNNPTITNPQGLGGIPPSPIVAIAPRAAQDSLQMYGANNALSWRVNSSGQMFCYSKATFEGATFNPGPYTLVGAEGYTGTYLQLDNGKVVISRDVSFGLPSGGEADPYTEKMLIARTTGSITTDGDFTGGNVTASGTVQAAVLKTTGVQNADYLKTNASGEIIVGTGTPTTSRSSIGVTGSNTNLSNGDVVYRSNSNGLWAKAQSNDPTTLAFGVVDNVQGSSGNQDFDVVVTGAVTYAGWNLSDATHRGNWVWLDKDTAGGLTTTNPADDTDGGRLVDPVGVVTADNTIYVVPARPHKTPVTTVATLGSNTSSISNASDALITGLSTNDTIKWNGSRWVNTPLGSSGTSDHGSLTGLTDDDHSQYALADGSRGSFAASSHTHAQSQITNLVTDLAGKAATSHTHTLANITDSGTAAALDVGTTANKVVQLDGSAKLPAVDGSQLTNVSGAGGTDYLSAPLTGTWRYFDDFFSITPDKGPNDGNNQFWLNQGGSGITPQDNNLVGGRGISMQTFSGNNRRYAWWGAGILGGHQPADGDELFWESRFYFVDSNATTGMVGLGVADSIATLNANDQIPGHTYSGFDFAAITIDLEQTNVLTCIKDTGGAGTPTPVDLGGSYPISSYVDTWIRLGIHVKYNAGDSDWDVTFYINGSSVGTGSMTFASCIVPFVGGGTGTHTGNCNQNIDWISYQGKIGSQISGRTTLIDIDDV